MTGRAGSSRIGILGGTLDPVHVGHIQAAVAAREALGLDDVVIMPARIPPHRQDGPSASPFHRFAMAALSVNDLPGFSVSDDELSSDGPSYTALTLERLAARGLDRSRIFFITGADAFAEIETWYRYPAVLDLAHFVVVSRPGTAASGIPDRLPQIAGRVRIAARHTDMPVTPSVFLVDAPTPGVSSTEVRRRLRAGESVEGMLPPAVERYIRHQRLYVNKPTADHVP